MREPNTMKQSCPEAQCASRRSGDGCKEQCALERAVGRSGEWSYEQVVGKNGNAPEDESSNGPTNSGR